MEQYETRLQTAGDLGKYSDELAEWYKIDNCFFGWLLTLNDKEFVKLYERVNGYIYKAKPDTEIGNLIMIHNFKGVPKDGTLMTEEILARFMSKTGADFALIALYRKGYIDIVDTSKPDDWSFKANEQGKKHLAELYNDKEEEKNM